MQPASGQLVTIETRSIDITHPIFYHFYMKTIEITDIDEMLLKLPKKRVQEVRDFAAYLLDREHRHKALVKRVLKAEKNPDTIICNTVEEAMQAVYNASV